MKKFLSLGLAFLLSMGVVAGYQVAVNAADVDVTTTASIVNAESAFVQAISKDGTWIVCTLNDLTFKQELVVEGEFHNKGNAANPVYRKLAPYTQDDKHNITGRFTITAPKMTVKSPNLRFQGGIFVGDIYVQAPGFNLSDAKVVGNVYFASKDLMSSFSMPKSQVTGTVAVK